MTRMCVPSPGTLLFRYEVVVVASYSKLIAFSSPLVVPLAADRHVQAPEIGDSIDARYRRDAVRVTELP